MHNLYATSAGFSLRTNGSLSFSFNDYSNLCNARFVENPLSCCSCCCCCSCCASATSSHRLSINPRILYGLRQSSLIQWSPSRRLVLGGGERRFSRFSGCDLDEGRYEGHCDYRERNVRDFAGFRRRSNGRFRCLVSEERNGRYQPDGVDYAEAVISLLCEEVGEEGLGIGERNRRSYKKMEGEKRKVYVSEFLSEKNKRVEGRQREKKGDECFSEKKKKKNRVEVEEGGEILCSECSRRKKNVVEEERVNRVDERKKREKRDGGAVLMERDSRSRYESVTAESKEDVYRRNEDNEASLRGEHCRGRTKSSSCSSYYSLSSGDMESELPDQDEHLVEESVSGYEKSRIEGRLSEGSKRHHDGMQEQEEVSELRNKTGRTNVDWDSRKTSEKKLAELSSEEIQSREKSSQKYSRMAKTHEKRRTSVHDHFDDREKKSAVGINLEQGTKKHYSQVDNQLIRHSDSRGKYRDETANIYSSTAEMTSQSQNQFSGREENLIVDVDTNLDTTEHREAIQRIAEEDLRRGSSYAMSEIQDIAEVRISTSNQQSDSRTKIQTEDRTSFQSSVQQTSEQHQQIDQRITAQIDLRRKSEHSSEISEINESSSTSKKAYISQSEIGRKKLEDKLTLASTTSTEAEEYFVADKKSRKRLETGKGSSSAGYGNSSEIVTSSQETSRQKMIEQESNITPVVRPIGEAKERHNETDETLKQIQSRRVAQKPDSPATSQQKAKEPSGSEASLILISQSREESIVVNEMNINTQAILMPPPSQLIARSCLREDPASGIVIQQVSGETSEHGSDVLYLPSGRVTNEVQDDQPAGEMDETYGESTSLTTQEDSLGSAHRLEQSSTHLVEEFMEKAKHEISTSETRIAHEYGEPTQDISDKRDTEDPKMEGHDGSRRSSGGSRAKGPSDQMWDEAGTSVQEPSEGEVPDQNSATENTVAKRTGRSLWNVMADIVQLRWSSRSQAPSSAARSGGRTSSGESASTEAWFSGREQDDNTLENPIREKTSRTQGGISYQSGSGKTSDQGQVNVPETMKSRDKARLPEGTSRSSLNKLDIVPASGGLSLSTTNENQEGDQLKVTPSSRQVAASSSTQPAGSLKSPVVEETSESASASATQSEPSGSGRKSGALKLRKFQRSAQVSRDRFDEWEEAYKVESEQRKMDEMFMREALLEAKKAADTWEVPVGAVLVQHGKVISRGYNLVEALRDSTAHAEMICIREGSNVLRSWRLADTTLYVTLEPCPMCAGAILQARINSLVWGAPNKLLGADGSWIRLFPGSSEGANDEEPSDKPPAPVHPFHPKMNIRRGVLEAECADAMQQFFQLRRKKKAAKDDDPPPPPPSCLPIAPHPSKLLTKMQDAFHITFCL